MARWQPDGNIEFLGRIDLQVKIRGFRIELEEIENQLAKHEEIKETIVLAIEDEMRNKYLCAYIVSNPVPESSFDPSKFKKYLSQSLPDYMIPSYFVAIEKIPLTHTGKIHRKALPAPVITSSSKYADPRDEVENKLVEIWSEILGRNTSHIGIDDNFFELGGHSLNATVMVSKIHRHLQVRIPLVEIFKISTIRLLAEYIKNTVNQRPGITDLNRDHNLVLLRKKSTRAKHLFFVHDGSGEVEGYVEFCRCLDAELDLNCWGIQADKPENYAPQNVTIEEIAARYIKKIKTLQPRGPYFIAGWSIGGTIAFEMAGQLEQMNEEIAFLALIDSPPPSPHAGSMEHVQKISRFTPESEKKFIEKYLSDEDIKNQLENVSDIQDTWAFIVDYLKSKHFDINIIKTVIKVYEAHVVPDYHQLNIHQLIRYLNIGRTFAHARELYIPPEKIHTTVHYFAASQSRGIKKKYWNNYCHKPITTYKVPGDHYSMFKKTRVQKFAKIFCNIFENVVK
jgi:fengycin family lipopeptide synthetase D/gramicidin S synthase 2/tyrocidine synthetase-3